MLLPSSSESLGYVVGGVIMSSKRASFMNLTVFSISGKLPLSILSIANP